MHRRKTTEILTTFAVLIINKIKILIILLLVFISANNKNTFLQMLLEGLAG